MRPKQNVGLNLGAFIGSNSGICNQQAPRKGKEEIRLCNPQNHLLSRGSASIVIVNCLLTSGSFTLSKFLAGGPRNKRPACSDTRTITSSTPGTRSHHTLFPPRTFQSLRYPAQLGRLLRLSPFEVSESAAARMTAVGLLLAEPEMPRGRACFSRRLTYNNTESGAAAGTRKAACVMVSCWLG